MEKIRLQKFMADCNIASRRGSEELIKAGRVTVNGVKAKIGDSVLPDRDTVAVDGKIIKNQRQDFTYIAFYKPRGVVTTMKDELGRPCISDYINENMPRLFPVGRLDRDSEGLLILTDDGELSNFLTKPASKVQKTYRVTINGKTNADVLRTFESGVVLDDGYRTEPCNVEIRDLEEKRAVLRVTIFEGKNRQIRRMWEALGFTVLLLKRESIGPLRLSVLKPGQMRRLTPLEISNLKTLKNE